MVAVAEPRRTGGVRRVRRARAARRLSQGGPAGAAMGRGGALPRQAARRAAGVARSAGLLRERSRPEPVDRPVRRDDDRRPRLRRVARARRLRHQRRLLPRLLRRAAGQQRGRAIHLRRDAARFHRLVGHARVVRIGLPDDGEHHQAVRGPGDALWRAAGGARRPPIELPPLARGAAPAAGGAGGARGGGGRRRHADRLRRPAPELAPQHERGDAGGDVADDGVDDRRRRFPVAEPRRRPGGAATADAHGAVRFAPTPSSARKPAPI